MSKISPQAIIEPGAQIADDVVIGPFCYVGPQVKIGPGCIIDNNVTLVGQTTLAEKNRVFPMAVIGAVSQSGPAGKCILGPANSIHEHVTIYAGATRPTRLGRDNLIMIDCQIGPGAVIGDHCIFANCTHMGAEARVEDYVQTSSFIAISPGVSVGTYTFMVAFAGVDRDAPPFAMIQGFPFRVRGVNSQKLKRCGFGDDDIRALKDAFHDIFNGGEQLAPAALEEFARRDDLNPQVRKLIEALQSAKGQGKD